jgi:hypothetical protein
MNLITFPPLATKFTNCFSPTPQSSTQFIPSCLSPWPPQHPQQPRLQQHHPSACLRLALVPRTQL